MMVLALKVHLVKTEQLFNATQMCWMSSPSFPLQQQTCLGAASNMHLLDHATSVTSNVIYFLHSRKCGTTICFCSAAI
jgi:hypothetical protein